MRFLRDVLFHSCIWVSVLPWSSRKLIKLKPLEAGSPLRNGLLATNATLTAGFYQEKLRSEGFEVVLPDKATMEHAVIPAIEAVNRKDMEGTQNLLRIALQVLLVRAVNTVILASDDMHNVLPQDDPLLKKCIDPMDALARSAIKWVQTAGKRYIVINDEHYVLHASPSMPSIIFK
ncbi:hypothetical protein OIU77_023634 [Salix suchowensis]|uniref:Uncharacterized protein n=1 Tax=Salix suchowensis TaxID=1278906 RepID=A0ABQ9C7N4_9ROSI|nr:hypothetical protein OIU77_023634 [Salix suchowensis]